MSTPDSGTGDVEALAEVLRAHFIMRHDLLPTHAGGPTGEWRCGCGLKFGFSDSAIDHQAERVATLLAQVRAEMWEEAAELADTQIVLWSEVPGLHPTAQEPHPAAIAASGARRTLMVLRSRMSEAFADRATPSPEPERGEGA